MDRFFVDAILQLTPLAQYWRGLPVLDETKSRITAACFNRAVLLPELPEVVLRNRLRVPIDELPSIRAISQQIQYDLSREMETPGKYLPLVAHRQGQSYDKWLRSSRPKGWTWLVMAACGVCIDGWHLGVGERV